MVEFRNNVSLKATPTQPSHLVTKEYADKKCNVSCVSINNDTRDPNTCLDSVFYSSHENCPVQGNSYLIYQYSIDNISKYSAKIQIATVVDEQVDNSEFYIRRGLWNPEGTIWLEWQQLATNEQINNLNDAPNADTINVTDANELPCGWYSGNLRNSPAGDWFTYHTFYKLGSGYKTQIAYGINNNLIYVRIYLSNVWEEWEQIVTVAQLNNALAINNLTQV